MPAMPKRHCRERAKARPGLVGLHTVRPGHRGRRPPARYRTGIHPAMLGVPDRHRAPASGRADLRRRLQKRALAAVAQAPAPGTLTAGGSRWSNPRRTSTIRSAGATYQDVLDAPAHQVAEIVNGTLYTHPRPAPQHATELRARRQARPTVPQGRRRPGRMADPRRAGAASRRGDPGAGLGRMAPGTHAGAPRHCVLHPRAGLGVRGALEFDAQGRPARKNLRSTRAKASPTCGSSNRWTAPSRRSNSTTGSGS